MRSVQGRWVPLLVLWMVAAVAVGAAEQANVDSPQKERLVQALSDLGAGPMPQESEFLREYVMGESADIAERISAFDEFLNAHPFTENHASNLEAHIAFGTADKERMARFAGAFAAASLRIYWEKVEAGVVFPTFALLFLERIFIHADETINNALAVGINDALHGRIVTLAPHLSAGGLSPGRYVEAAQCCVTLGVFKGDRAIGQWLDLPRRMAEFADAVGVWLFDSEALSEAQVRCLESLFKTVPQPMHGVAVLLVPEAIPFNAVTSPLRLPGRALDIPSVPMELLRNLSEMPPYVSQPPVPEFTALALEQIMQAVVATRLPSRPDLTQRAAAVMRLAIARPDSPLARLAPPEIMTATPDLFLAYLGMMWLANAEALLEAAIMLAEEGVPEPLYAILLVADLFSAQGDTTLLFRVTPTGTLSAAETALRRMFLSPLVSYANGIAFAGRLWQYDMSNIALLP